MAFNLFGFSIQRKEKDEIPSPSAATFVDVENDDGAVVVAAGGVYGTYLDLDGAIRTEAELVTKYREVSMVPEVDMAIQDIVDEAIVDDPKRPVVTINLDDVEGLPDQIKDIIVKEFEQVLYLLNFQHSGYEIFRRWYIDGRLYYHLIVDEKEAQAGIKEVRLIDPRNIRKIRQVRRAAQGNVTGFNPIIDEQEFYVYMNRQYGTANNMAQSPTMLSNQQNVQGLRISKDAITQVTSGLMDINNTVVLSYLHKALRTVNQLTQLEDSTIIYRIARAPERRVWYIDTGNLPKGKAEQYLHDQMTKFKNKLVYDAVTGKIRDDRKMMSMLEDIWLPRHNGKATEVQTLPAGNSTGAMEEVEYFLNKLYDALGVPRTRRDETAIFSVGHSGEISRDEVKFSKFISRLRARFSSGLFTDILGKNLVLKGILLPEEWEFFRNNVRYDFARDNLYQELKDTEIWSGRIQQLSMIDSPPFIGKYFSRRWAQTNILKMSEDEIRDNDQEIMEEMSDPFISSLIAQPLDDPTGPPQPEDNSSKK